MIEAAELLKDRLGTRAMESPYARRNAFVRWVHSSGYPEPQRNHKICQL